jgi:DNA-binding XRE family transcriptional regulator/tetratricopeptide (TPR) repeat protein
MARRRKRFAARRKSLGFTQEAFAERLELDARTVRRWEVGEVSPQPWLQPRIARLLQVSHQQLEGLLAENSAEIAECDVPTGVLLPVIIDGRAVLLPVDGRTVAASSLGPHLGRAADLNGEAHPVVTATEWDAMSPANRRALLKYGLSAAALPALGLEELHKVATAMEDAHRYLDTSVTDYFRRQLALAKADDGSLGLAKPLPITLGILGAIEEHARDVKPTVRRELLQVGADCAEFAGWLYRDARDMPRALYWHDRAIEWAQESGDLAMQGYVLLKKAQLAYDEREPTRMLTLAQAVQNVPWQLPARVRAEAAQQEARAEAMLGATDAVIDGKLDQARELLARDSLSENSPHLGAHYNDVLLTMQTAVCYTEAGNPRRAVELYDRALTESAFSPRDYGFFLSWMASSLALAGEPDQAAAAGTEAARRATASGSQRTSRELIRVLDVLKPWQNRPAVRELQHAVRT